MSGPHIAVLLDAGFFRVVARRDGSAQITLGTFDPTDDGIPLEDCRLAANRYARRIADVLQVAAVQEHDGKLTRRQ